MKPYIKRALRTFAQTAAGYAVANLTIIDLNAKNALAGLAVSAIAAGLAAVMNLNESEEKS